ncbi:hypothetical protein HAX54_022295 [Datura stramonium]|uniref:Uncharacterized protein n=1 Tax=Datura stramonium TaxID=4076 RepID=A0ABS8S3Z3_DATST|nr:hypothetical protein [Datura stramonium]
MKLSRGNYAAAVSEQRHYNSILKAFFQSRLFTSHKDLTARPLALEKPCDIEPLPGEAKLESKLYSISPLSAFSRCVVVQHFVLSALSPSRESRRMLISITPITTRLVCLMHLHTVPEDDVVAAMVRGYGSRELERAHHERPERFPIGLCHISS